MTVAHKTNKTLSLTIRYYFNIIIIINCSLHTYVKNDFFFTLFCSYLGDVQTFYETPVNTTTPLDTMKKLDLPPNLHVQYEPIRFHPGKEFNILRIRYKMLYFSQNANMLSD